MSERIPKNDMLIGRGEIDDEAWLRLVGLATSIGGKLVSHAGAEVIPELHELEVASRHINLSDFDTFAQIRNLYPSVATRAYQGIGRLYLDQRKEDSPLGSLPLIQIDSISDGDGADAEIANVSFRDVRVNSFREFVEAYEDKRAAEPTKTARLRFDYRLPRLVARGTMEFYVNFFDQLDNQY